MISISYPAAILFISALWILVRICVRMKTGRLSVRRELQLLLVWVCLIVVARFTFFPFGRVDGRIQPLLFSADEMLPPRINLVPFVYLFDYPTRREALINLIGNTSMFIPIGIIWPLVFPRLSSHARVIAAGVGFTLCIELLQLPFFDRVTDIDDLILNAAGFLLGYLPVAIVRAWNDRRKFQNKS